MSEMQIEENLNNNDKLKLNENEHSNDNKEIKNDVNNNKTEQSNEKNKDLAIGQYILSPIERILLNSLLPKGFKFETEENVLKSIETATKNKEKKEKQSTKVTENSKSRQKKKGNNVNTIHNSKQNINSNTKPEKDMTSENYTLMMKCLSILEKIRKSPYSNSFFFPQKDNPSSPSLSNIERKIRNYDFKNLYSFETELRNLWSYYYGECKGNGELYQKVTKLSELTENVLKEMESNKDEIVETSIKKQSQKTESSQNYQKQYPSSFSREVPPPKKTSNKNIENKTMSLDEKNELGNQIRSLNKEQLKGIIRILSEGQEEKEKKKYFEFDIDRLPVKKLRELERYVKVCMGENEKNKKTIHTNEKETSNIPGNRSDNVRPINQITQSTNNQFNRNEVTNRVNNNVQNNISSNLNSQQQHPKNNTPNNSDEFSSSESDSDSVSSSLSN